MIPQLYRKRIIPNETVKLSNDKIVYSDADVIITKWKPIRPRKDIGSGESCYIIDKGIKASRFYDLSGVFIYWYFDIIHTDFNPQTYEYVFTDLLVDVIVYPDGFVKVVDVEELAETFESGLIDGETLINSLKKLSELLNVVYDNRVAEVFGKYFETQAKISII